MYIFLGEYIKEIDQLPEIDMKYIDMNLFQCLKRETNLDKVITYHFLNPNDNINEEKDALKEFLKKPYGALITDAEAFNGMQARNIIFVGGRSPNVRWVTIAEYSGNNSRGWEKI